MKQLLLIILCFHSLLGFNQSTNDNDTLFAFLNEPIKSSTVVYYAPVGNNAFFTIDNPNDDFYQIILIKKRFNRYYVKIRNLSINDFYVRYGWINCSSAGIGFTHNNIEVFEKPTEKSNSYKLTIQSEAVIATVLDYDKKGWMKVSFYWNNSRHIGWIPKKYQCSNAFTMCCGS